MCNKMLVDMRRVNREYTIHFYCDKKNNKPKEQQGGKLRKEGTHTDHEFRRIQSSSSEEAQPMSHTSTTKLLICIKVY